MSAFSNPLRDAPEAAGAYVRALLGVLGDRDPLDVLPRTPARLRDALEGVPDDSLRRPEAPGKWPLVAVAQHLADSELVYGYRVHLTVGQDRPAIQGYDQDAWAANLRYDAVRLEDALADFEALRAMNLRLLRALPEAGWERVGLHAERGEESVRQLTRLMAAHDLVHLRQIARIKQAVAG